MFDVGDKVTPISLSGSNFKNSKLDLKSHIAVISPSLKSYLFELFFYVLIWGSFCFMASIALNDDSAEVSNFMLIISVFSFGFSGIVRFIFYRIRHIRCFDKKLGIYYTGKNIEESSTIKLSEIVSFYLISKEIYSSGKSYTTHELSFCTLGGKRIMIMNYADRYAIKLDAERLSTFLGVPCEYLKSGDTYE